MLIELCSKALQAGLEQTLLSEHERNLISESFETIATAQDNISLEFYHRLFETAPSLRSLFPKDVEPQASKLIKLIGMAVGSVNHLDSLQIPLRELGELHRQLGVKAEQFELLEDVLMETFAIHLADIWTAEHEMAWRRLLSHMASVMLDRSTNGIAACLPH